MRRVLPVGDAWVPAQAGGSGAPPPPRMGLRDGTVSQSVLPATGRCPSGKGGGSCGNQYSRGRARAPPRSMAAAAPSPGRTRGPSHKVGGGHSAVAAASSAAAAANRQALQSMASAAGVIGSSSSAESALHPDDSTVSWSTSLGWDWASSENSRIALSPTFEGQSKQQSSGGPPSPRSPTRPTKQCDDEEEHNKPTQRPLLESVRLRPRASSTNFSDTSFSSSSSSSSSSSWASPSSS
jgi:hypothetical protein